jgi:Mce-associated membrane protein
MTVLDERPAADPGPAPARRDLVRPLTIAVAVAAVLAVVLGVLWAVTLTDGGRELAETRDVVLVDAQRAAVTLNSLDSAAVEPGLDAWEQMSTGGLLDEFRANRAEYAQLVAASQRTTTATVVDAAVAELDLRSGVARVLVGVDVEVSQAGQEPTLVRNRIQLEMTRTEQGWKASNADVLE